MSEWWNKGISIGRYLYYVKGGVNYWLIVIFIKLFDIIVVMICDKSIFKKW